MVRAAHSSGSSSWRKWVVSQPRAARATCNVSGNEQARGAFGRPASRVLRLGGGAYSTYGLSVANVAWCRSDPLTVGPKIASAKPRW